MKRQIVMMAALVSAAAVAQETPPQSIQGLDNFSIERPAPVRPDTSATPVPTPAAPVIALPAPKRSPIRRPRERAPVVPAPMPASAASPAPAPIPTSAPATDVPTVVPAVEASPGPVETPDATPAPAPAEGRSWWWALGLLLIVAAGGAFAFRRSRGETTVEEKVGDPVEGSVASAVESSAAEAIERPAPPPVPAEPAAPPANTTPKGGGLITSSLRAQIGLELHALWVSVDTLRVQLDYEIVISNLGAAKSRELFVEMAMLSAGTVQDAALADFYAAPPGEPIAESDGLAAGAWARLGGQALLSRDAFDIISAGGKQMFVPLMAARVLGPTGAIVAKTAWLVGIEREGQARMAPLRLDGRAVQTSLGVRPYP